MQIIVEDRPNLPAALNRLTGEELLVAFNFELPAGPAPEWLELIPAGQSVVGRDGRKWLNDRPQEVLAAFNADARDLVIDTEHATQLKAPKGEPAPAAGWVKALEARNAGAIWGRVEWTPAGALAVANREYRYISPVFTYEEHSGRIAQLVSIGLTNRPNLRLTALNQIGRSRPQEEEMLKKLLLALGLAENATEEQALNAIGTLRTDLATALNRAKTPDLQLFVPRADYDQVQTRAINAEKALADRAQAEQEAEIARVIDAALKAGKITPATKERSEERRVGKECRRLCRSRWSPYH
jgi:phage I-like protein